MADKTYKMKFITAKELEKDKEKFLILDIREQERFLQGHIEGCNHIVSYNDLKFGNIDLVKSKFKELPKEKPIVTVCNVGVTAQKASAVLEQMGYNTLVLEYGMSGWNALKGH